MNNDKISKASNVRKPHPVYMLISEGLSSIDKLNYVKIYKERIMASNVLSDNCKKQPVVKSVPDYWKIVVCMDWNHGFWESMVKKYHRIIMF